MRLPHTAWREVEIDVLDEVWLVPYGFGRLYKAVALQHIESTHTGDAQLQVLRDLLGLVGYEASIETLQRWGLRKRVDAHVYCANVHARASDNPIRRCRRPFWLPEPWTGPERGEGVWAGPGPTVLS